MINIPILDAHGQNRWKDRFDKHRSEIHLSMEAIAEGIKERLSSGSTSEVFRFSIGEHRLLQSWVGDPKGREAMAAVLEIQPEELLAWLREAAAGGLEPTERWHDAFPGLRRQEVSVPPRFVWEAQIWGVEALQAALQASAIGEAAGDDPVRVALVAKTGLGGQTAAALLDIPGKLAVRRVHRHGEVLEAETSVWLLPWDPTQVRALMDRLHALDALLAPALRRLNNWMAAITADDLVDVPTIHLIGALARLANGEAAELRSAVLDVSWQKAMRDVPALASLGEGFWSALMALRRASTGSSTWWVCPRGDWAASVHTLVVERGLLLDAEALEQDLTEALADRRRRWAQVERALDRLRTRGGDTVVDHLTNAGLLRQSGDDLEVDSVMARLGAARGLAATPDLLENRWEWIVDPLGLPLLSDLGRAAVPPDRLLAILDQAPPALALDAARALVVIAAAHPELQSFGRDHLREAFASSALSLLLGSGETEDVWILSDDLDGLAQAIRRLSDRLAPSWSGFGDDPLGCLLDWSSPVADPHGHLAHLHGSEGTTPEGWTNLLRLCPRLLPPAPGLPAAWRNRGQVWRPAALRMLQAPRDWTWFVEMAGLDSDTGRRWRHLLSGAEVPVPWLSSGPLVTTSDADAKAKDNTHFAQAWQAAGGGKATEPVYVAWIVRGREVKGVWVVPDGGQWEDEPSTEDELSRLRLLLPLEHRLRYAGTMGDAQARARGAIAGLRDWLEERQSSELKATAREHDSQVPELLKRASNDPNTHIGIARAFLSIRHYDDDTALLLAEAAGDGELLTACTREPERVVAQLDITSFARAARRMSAQDTADSSWKHPVEAAIQIALRAAQALLRLGDPTALRRMAGPESLWKLPDGLARALSDRHMLEWTWHTGNKHGWLLLLRHHPPTEEALLACEALPATTALGPPTALLWEHEQFPDMEAAQVRAARALDRLLRCQFSLRPSWDSEASLPLQEPVHVWLESLSVHRLEWLAPPLTDLRREAAREAAQALARLGDGASFSAWSELHNRPLDAEMERAAAARLQVPWEPWPKSSPWGHTFATGVGAELSKPEIRALAWTADLTEQGRHEILRRSLGDSPTPSWCRRALEEQVIALEGGEGEEDAAILVALETLKRPSLADLGHRALQRVLDPDRRLEITLAANACDAVFHAELRRWLAATDRPIRMPEVDTTAHQVLSHLAWSRLSHELPRLAGAPEEQRRRVVAVLTEAAGRLPDHAPLVISQDNVLGDLIELALTLGLPDMAKDLGSPEARRLAAHRHPARFDDDSLRRLWREEHAYSAWVALVERGDQQALDAAMEKTLTYFACGGSPPANGWIGTLARKRPQALLQGLRAQVEALPACRDAVLTELRHVLPLLGSAAGEAALWCRGL